MASLRFISIIILGVLALGALAARPNWGRQESMTLSAADKTRLFQIARDSIRAYLDGKSPPPLQDLPPQLLEPRGIFVSLHRQGRLRGCIGYLEAVKPLGPAAQEMAMSAAFRDPRFRPLEPGELDDLEIEISILTPMRRIEKVEEVEVGRHGLYIEQGSYRGLLLPQVATECRWDRQTFLEQTCCKACLPPDAWKDKDTRIYVFTAEILSEGPAKSGCARQESKKP